MSKPKAKKPRPVRCWTYFCDGKLSLAWPMPTRGVLETYKARNGLKWPVVRCLLVPYPPRPRKKGGGRK